MSKKEGVFLKPVVATYAVPESLAGKTLRQLQQEGFHYVADQIEAPSDSPLKAGQYLNYRTDDPTYRGGAQYLNLNKYFGNPLSSQDITSLEQKKALAARQQAVAPAVKSLEESVPEISQKFGTEKTRLAGEKEPLKQRYQSILDDLKRRETQETEKATLNTANELARRGITGGGFYDTQFTEATRPISEFYGTQGKDVSLSQEQGLSNIDKMIADLTGTEVESVRSVRNAIAQIQSGAGNASIEDAFQQLQFQEQQRQFDQSQSLEQEKLKFTQQGRAVEEAMSQRNFAEQVRQYNQNLAEQQRQFSLNYGLESAKEKRLSTPFAKTPTPTKLEFREVTDALGNKIVVALDPYTGKIVSTSNPIQLGQQVTSGTSNSQSQSGFNNVLKWLNPFD